jgi:hypothetical protein
MLKGWLSLRRMPAVFVDLRRRRPSSCRDRARLHPRHRRQRAPHALNGRCRCPWSTRSTVTAGGERCAQLEEAGLAIKTKRRHIINAGSATDLHMRCGYNVYDVDVAAKRVAVTWHWWNRDAGRYEPDTGHALNVTLSTRRRT